MKIELRDVDQATYVLIGDETSIKPDVYEFLLQIVRRRYPKTDKIRQGAIYRVDLSLDGTESEV